MISNNNAGYSYDALVDVLSVKSNNLIIIEESIELNPNIYLSFDDKGIPVAIEFLDASKLLKVNKLGLNKIMKIDISININNDNIKVLCKFIIPKHGGNVEKRVNQSISNKEGMQPINIELATA
jgi:uncharacterized protein YuzE